MRACATAGGAVIFIPDCLEENAKTRQKPMSYSDITPKKTSRPSALDRLEKIARKIANLKKAA